MRVTVQNYRRGSEAENILEIAGCCTHDGESTIAVLLSWLAAAKILWPDDPKLNNTYIVELDK